MTSSSGNDGLSRVDEPRALSTMEAKGADGKPAYFCCVRNRRHPIDSTNPFDAGSDMSLSSGKSEAREASRRSEFLVSLVLVINR